MIIEDKSYGIIPVLRGNPDRFLIVHQTNDVWGFPKGHPEGAETPHEAALRELKEETGITEGELIDSASITDEYTFEKEGKKYHKVNEFFIAIVARDTVVVQEEEVSEYTWATYEEALKIFNYEETKHVLKTACVLLDRYDKR